MSAKKPNTVLSVDVSRSGPEYPSVTAFTKVSDISDGHVWMLMEHALRQGGTVGQRIMSLWGFEPTEAELEELAAAVARIAPEKVAWAKDMKHWKPLWWPEGT